MESKKMKWKKGITSLLLMALLVSNVFSLQMPQVFASENITPDISIEESVSETEEQKVLEGLKEAEEPVGVKEPEPEVEESELKEEEVKAENVQILDEPAPEKKGLTKGAAIIVTTEDELIDNVNNADQDKEITLDSSFPKTLTKEITLTVNHAYNITIIGMGNQPKVLQPLAGKKHIKIAGTGIGNLKFQNIQFEGLIADSYFLGEEFIGIPETSIAGGGVSGTYGGSIQFVNSIFTKINGGALKVDGTKGTEISNSSIVKNYGTSAAGMELGSKKTTIKKSTFAYNLSIGGWGYNNATLFRDGAGEGLHVENTSFYMNKKNTTSSVNNSHMHGGGVLTVRGEYPVSIIDSTFTENATDFTAPTGTGTTADGGALYFFHATGKIQISNSTFVGNKAFDEGGALSFVGVTHVENVIENSTFYGNEALGNQTSDGTDAGGAIEVKSATGAKSNMLLDSNTFTRNIARKGKASGVQRAGAVYSDSTTKAMLKNNVIVGNYVELADGSLDKDNSYANTYYPISSTSFKSYYTDLGGNVIDELDKDVFGVSTIELQSLNNKKAGDVRWMGNSKLYTGILTIPIAPEGEADDLGSTTELTYDQNGIERDTSNNDSGSVETKWIKFEGNKGSWQKAELSNYNGTIYYRGANPETYYVMYPYNAAGVTLPVNQIPETKPSVPGTTFIEWNTKADGSGTSYEPGASVGNITSGTTLYATWSNTYSVTYKSNGGNVEEYIDGGLSNGNYKVLGDKVFTKDGYKFTEWNTKIDGTGTGYNAEIEGKDSLNLVQDGTLYAQWKPVQKITYKANGGVGVDVVIDEIDKGTTVLTEKNSFTRVLQAFVNWNTEADGTGVAYDEKSEIKVDEDIVLYAQWGAAFGVNYRSNGGTVTSIPAIYVLKNTNHTVLTNPFIKIGYAFTGWNEKADNTGEAYAVGSQIEIIKTIYLYAQWEEGFKVTFDANQGQYEDESSSKDIYNIKNEKINKTELENLPKLTKVGFAFTSKWYKDAAMTDEWNFDTDQVSEDTILYAGWEREPVNYAVTFDANGGTYDDGTVGKVLAVLEDTTISKQEVEKLPKLSLTGYTFTNKWYKDAAMTDEWNFSTDQVTGDTVLYAGRVKIPVSQFTVTFLDNDGSEISKIESVLAGAKISEPQKPSKDGYVFEGWYKDKEYNIKWNFNSDTVNSDTMLYAKWKKNVENPDPGKPNPEDPGKPNPEDPEKPNKKPGENVNSKNTTNTKNQTRTGVQTGDSIGLQNILILLGVSLVGVIATIVSRKNKKSIKK